MTDPRFEAWLGRMKAADQPKKNSELAFAVDNLGYQQVEALLQNGAEPKDAAGGIPFLAWAIRRTDDVRMTELLLDNGVSAKGVEFKDLWAFFEEDKEQAYKLLERLAVAGMTLEERAKAGIYALQQGQAGYIERRLLLPGEDIVSLVDSGKGFDKDGVLAQVPVNDDAAKALYKAHFANGLDAAKLKETVSKEGMTGFMLAVRAGKFDDVADFYRSGKGGLLDPQEVIREDIYGQSVVSLLGHRRKLAQLFAADLWQQQPEAALIVLEKVPEKYGDQLDKLRITREIAQARLATRAKDKPSRLPGT